MNTTLNNVQQVFESDMIQLIIGLIALVLARILLYFLKTYFNYTLDSIRISKPNNKCKNIWIKLLREDELINKYLRECTQLTKYENVDGSLKSILAMAFVFSFTYIFIIQLLGTAKFNFWISMGSISLFYNFIGFSVTIYVMRKMYNTSTKIYDIATLVVNYIETTKFYMLMNNGMHLLFILMFYQTRSIPLSDKDEISMMLFSISIALALVAYFQLRVGQKDFTYLIKEAINIKILKECPRISISTDSKKVQGSINNIFDDEYILLEDAGCKTLIKWDDIISLQFLNEESYIKVTKCNCNK
jgi:hypothetical protein